MSYETRFFENTCPMCTRRSKKQTQYNSIWSFACEHACRTLENHAEAIQLLESVFIQLLLEDYRGENVSLDILEGVRQEVLKRASQKDEAFFLEKKVKETKQTYPFTPTDKFRKYFFRDKKSKYYYSDSFTRVNEQAVSTLDYYVRVECRHPLTRERVLESLDVNVNYFTINGDFLLKLMKLIRQEERNLIESWNNQEPIPKRIPKRGRYDRILSRVQHHLGDFEGQSGDFFYEPSKKREQNRDEDLGQEIIERKALEVEYKAIISKLTTYAFSILGEKKLAEDAVGNAIVSSLSTGTEPDNLLAYLMVSVKRSAIALKKSIIREHNILKAEAELNLKSDTYMFDYDSIGQNNMGDCVFPLLGNLIDKLPDKQREAIIRYYGHGNSYEEIGVAMGCSSRSVEGYLRRAKKSIKKQYIQSNN